jgi:[ribosomal protein S5]-alanine N-acetyltransferase
MIPILETPRLWLRPLQLEDAAQIQILFPHWEIVKHLAGRVPWPYPPDGALTYSRDFALPAMERGNELHWTLRLKSQPEQAIGCISLMKAESDNRGFWLACHGKGKD